LKRRMIIPVPIGESWTVTQHSSVRATYRCPACPFQSPVMVQAVTQGRELNLMWTDANGAIDTAGRRADAAVVKAVSHHLGLVPCPKCGALGARALEVLREQRLGAGLTAFFLGLVVFGLGLPVVAITDSVEALVATGVLTLAMLVAAYRWALRRAVRRRIQFSRQSVVFGVEQVARVSAPI
jgi:hypothetical protein